MLTLAAMQVVFVRSETISYGPSFWRDGRQLAKVYGYAKKSLKCHSDDII